MTCKPQCQPWDRSSYETRPFGCEKQAGGQLAGLVGEAQRPASTLWPSGQPEDSCTRNSNSDEWPATARGNGPHGEHVPIRLPERGPPKQAPEPLNRAWLALTDRDSPSWNSHRGTLRTVTFCEGASHAVTMAEPLEGLTCSRDASSTMLPRVSRRFPRATADTPAGRPQSSCAQSTRIP